MPPERPTVLYVASVPFVGGAELTQLNVLRVCLERGAVVRAVVPAAGALTDRVTALGAQVVVGRDIAPTLRASRYRASARNWAAATTLMVPPRSLAAAIRGLDSGVVYCGGLRAQARASLVSSLTRRPLAWHVHEHYDGHPERAMRLLGRLPQLTLTVSKSVAEQGGLASAKHVVPVLNGVPDAFFDTPLRTAAGERVLIAAVGHLTPLKGHEDFLSLVKTLRAENARIDARLYGGAPYLTTAHGDYRNRVLSTARALGVECAAVAPEDMPAELAGVDLLVHVPRRPEGFGRALAEAQAAGVPVVTFAWGGASEIVIDGRTGSLVPPGDLAAAREATLRLARDPGLRREMGRAAREHARTALRERRAGEAAASELLALC